MAAYTPDNYSRADRREYESFLVFLRGSEDLEWLRTTHLRSTDCPAEFGSAVLYGWTEDSPARIQVFADDNPSIDESPLWETVRPTD